METENLTLLKAVRNQRLSGPRPSKLKQIALDAAQNIQGEFDSLQDSVDSTADSLVNSLAEKYNQNLAELDSQLDTLKEADKGLLEQATDNLSGVIQTISSLGEMLMGVLNSAVEVVTTIIADPIGFLSNLIDGVGQGLQNFVGNIGTHLQTGLATWLFGETAKAGIEMPETFDMKGLLQLGMQVLGLTWDFIRNRAAKLLGEEVVSKLEESFELFIIIKEQGLGGLWEHIQEQVGDLKETIIGGIKEMVASEVIEAGIQWLIGILGGPAGAFIKAAKAIYDLVMWFVDNGSQMLELVQAVINGVTAIAGGAVGQAAQYVEDSLAKAIPVTIGFLASLLGLGDLSSKIKGIIEQAQEPITRAIDWVIGKAKAFAQTMKSKLGLGKDEQKDALGMGEDEEGAGLKTGLAAIDAEEEKYLNDKDEIQQQEAQQVAATVQGQHPVFQSITVVDGGKTWDYEYILQLGRKKGSKKKLTNNQERRRELLADLQDRYEADQELFNSLGKYDQRKKDYNELASEIEILEVLDLDVKTDEEHTDWYEFLIEIEEKLSNLRKSIAKKSKDELEPSYPVLILDWDYVESDTIYIAPNREFGAKFSKNVIDHGRIHDQDGFHLKAINNGRVAPKKKRGLVPSQEPGYDFKSKSMHDGGGHHRYHAVVINENEIIVYNFMKYKSDKY